MSTIVPFSQTRISAKSMDSPKYERPETRALRADDIYTNAMRRRIALSSLTAYVLSSLNQAAANNPVEWTEEKP